jgi:hypothetical protein
MRVRIVALQTTILVPMLCVAAAAADSEYEKAVNDALRQKLDVWGEGLVQKGGATYENIKDYLNPLFYSTGTTPRSVDVHNLLFGLDGGEPPWVIPVANGSRIYADNYRSIRYLEVLVGPKAEERYGTRLEHLRGPTLEQGYYPILETEYSDQEGNVYSQESFAAMIPELPDVVAMIKVAIKNTSRSATPKIALALSQYDLENHANRLTSGRKTFLVYSGTPQASWDRHQTRLTWNGPGPVYAVWLPNPAALGEWPIDADRYEHGKADWRAYWDARLTKGSRIDIPEKIASDALKNEIIQNLILRHRYSLGAAVYHTDWYPREGCDSLNALGLLGYTEEYRAGLDYMLGKSWREREFGNMATWGEYLAHASRYYFLTRDAEFIHRNTSLYEQYARTMQEQIEADPNGIVGRTHRTADIGSLGYWTNEEAVCWRGLRDMTLVWRLTGRNDLYQRYAPVAARLHASLLKAVDAAKVRMADGSLFVPIQLLAGQKPFESITETREGSYWNLTFPYAIGSGLWEPGSPDMDGIIAYMRKHGALLLGLLRFNSYPTPVGGFQKDGMPGYFTSGFDNVYLLGYLQALADRDDAEHLILSFYGKLAHGMTRNTFSEGEGSSVGPVPEYEYRTTYGTPNSTNNGVYLETLRLMLARESFNSQSGMPEGLYLAYATPRAWLEHGKQIAVERVPTFFGPLAYEIRSDLGNRRITATVHAPSLEAPQVFKLKLRVPGKPVMQSVSVNGRRWTKYDAGEESIDLTGSTGTLRIEVEYQQ